MASTSISTAAAPMWPLLTTEEYSPALLTPRPRHPSVSSFTTQTSVSTAVQGSLASDAEISVWHEKHMQFWKIPPTTVQARAWMLEAFDYFNCGGYELPYQLRGIETELRREWRRQNAEKQSATTLGAKRKSDAASSSTANKKTKTGSQIKSEETSAVSMPPPSRKPLGTLKGKYAIKSLVACCDNHTQHAHDEICCVVLSPGNGTTMRGYFNTGIMLDQYKAFIFFEKCPSESSSRKVLFRWWGRHICNDFKEYRGDENRGWMKFLGDGKIEVWFDKFNMRLIAQKGRGIGGRNQHDVAGFWEDWHELDDEVWIFWTGWLREMIQIPIV